MSNVPKLRFSGFEGMWEEETLDQLGSFKKGSVLGKQDLSSEGTPCILYGELYTKYGEITTRVESRTEKDYCGLLRSEYGDILIPASGETANDISTSTCLLLSNVIIGGDINLYRSKNIDGRYLSYLLNYKKKNEIARLAQGASVVHIYSVQLKSIKIPTPSAAEQTKIADFFTLIDKKSTRQNEKVATLEKYKKGLMQKIFSQKLRFKDDEGRDYPEWVNKQLRDIAAKITDKNRDYTVRNVLSNSAKMGLIKQSAYFNKDIANEKNIDGYYVIKPGDFVYNPRKSNEAPYGPIRAYKDIELGIVSPLYMCFRVTTNDNLRFLSYYFESTRWYKFIYEKGDRGARHDRVSIHDNTFFNMDIQLPSLPEQTKIANFLWLCDRKIEKEKEKLEQLREQKKSLLQYMFV